MPMFSTQPSGDLTSSIRNAVASLGSGAVSPIQLMQAQNMGAEAGYHSAMAQKVLQEVQQAKDAASYRSNPANGAAFAGNIAGLNTPDYTRLAGALRGDMEQPSAADTQDAALAGNTAQPFKMAAPPSVTPFQQAQFQSGLATWIANQADNSGKSNAHEMAQAAGEFQGQAITRMAQDALARGDAQGASALSQAGKLGTPIKLWEHGTGTDTTFNPATGAIQGQPPYQHVTNPITGQTDAFNPQTGEVKPANPAAAASTAANAGLSGPEFLATLPKPQAAQVQAMLEGRLQFPTAMALKTPYWQNMLSTAAQVDPEFDATIWKRRNDTAAAFAKGKEAGQVKSIDQALTHAGLMKQSIDDLDNFNGIATPLNSIVNPVEQMFGNTKQGVFEMNARALSSELRKVYAGAGGGSLSELQSWESGLPLNASKEQQTAYLSRGMDLLRGAMGALGDQYERAMGPNAKFSTLFSPSALSALEKLTGGDGAAPTTPAVNPRISGGAIGAPATPAVTAAPPGQSLTIGGKSYPILRYDADGTPIVKTPTGEARARKVGPNA